jgi:predicted GTPase
MVRRFSEQSASADYQTNMKMPGAWIDDPTWADVNPYGGAEGEDEAVVIAVMGVTGVGKSTFIRTVSERDDVIVGDSLSSGA